MDNGDAGGTWGIYLRRLANRPGWNVTKLARASGLDPSTVFEWIRTDSGEKVKTSTLLALADAVGESPVDAFRAAAGIMEGDPDDTEIADVLKSDLDDDGKQEIIEDILDRRERDRERRRRDTAQMIRFRGGKAS
jgi:transcriptional regulator with XRE-family HTH domain